MKSDLLFITGLPNSGTSMMAKIAHNSGLFLGTKLKRGDSHNPGGYYEDIPCMLFLDKWITSLGHDFGRLTLSQLKQYKNVSFVDQYMNLLSSRNLECVKDCRLMLILDQLLAKSPNSKAILMLRKLDDCIKSNNRYHTDAMRDQLIQHNGDKIFMKIILRYFLSNNFQNIVEGRLAVLKYEDFTKKKLLQADKNFLTDNNISLDVINSIVKS